MSGIAKIIGLRLVRTTRYITKQNTTKYLQSMCHVRNGFSHNTKNSITSAQKGSAGYWKTISAVTKKILWYSTIPFTIIVVNIAIYYTDQFKTDPTYWEIFDMLGAVDNETLKYSIIPSKIITSSVLFDDSEIKIKSREDNLTLMNNNTRNLIISKELDANIQEPFPKGEPIPVKIGKLNGLLDNGKLTLKTEDGDTTFTFHHTLSLGVKKTSTTLQNEIAAEKIEEPETTLKKNGKFNYTYSGSKTTFKTPTSEKKWTTIHKPSEEFRLTLPSYEDLFPRIGNFSLLFENIVKIQADESDEVYHFKHNVNIECDKKVDKNLQNKIAVVKELSRDNAATKELSIREILTEEIKTCYVLIDNGTVVFKRPDGHRVAVRYKLHVEVYEDGEKTYLIWLPEILVFPSKPLFTFF
ncbi:hypothetical protein HCN44_008016 [Aphidius gifuensis]|uniref:Uncharacterized protein n=1 Tax=Aphidius gifuensis TaxID=684658 RepID=A0A835CMK3_APHGI|nr:hypothetical protein HCN44_008016 [Aphidius gifuensis]